MTATIRASTKISPTPAEPARERYGVVAASLHWLIAALILFQVGFAWWVLGRVPDHSPAQAQDLRVHMSIGLTILLLSAVRVVVRLATPPPPLPATMARWDRFLAQASHALFYVLIIILPLTGWALASLRPTPIYFWELFVWPHLPGIEAARGLIHHPLGSAHTVILLWITLVLLVLHVAGAIKNHFGLGPVFWRMLPISKPTRPGAND